LDGTDGRGGALNLKEEEGVTNRDLVTGTQKALLDGDAVDEGAGGRFEVREQEAFILAGYLAMKARDGRIVNTNWVGGVSAYQQRRREAEFGLSEGTTER
jgi:hypothetical protein